MAQKPSEEEALPSGSMRRHGKVEIVERKTYHRFTFRRVLEDLLDLFLLNRGLPFTLKELFIQPGRVIDAYISTGRDRYTHPLKYFVLIAGLYLFIVLQLGLYRDLPNSDVETTAVAEMLFQRYFLNYMNVWMAVGVLFFALISRRLYRSSGYNFTEHVIANLYATAQVTLLYIPLALLDTHLPDGLRQLLEMIVGVLFTYWVFKNWLGGGIWATGWRTLIIVLGGTLLFVLTVGFFFFLIGVFYGVMGREPSMYGL